MRWKYVVPTVIVLVLVLVFGFFLLDPLLKWGMIAAGQYAFGAKVEIASVKTKVSKLSIDIRGVQVADRKNPMTNLLELGAVTFGVQPVPLLSKKIIVDEMRVEGVRWGTARKTSGALPPRKQKKIDARQAEAAKHSLTGKLTSKLEARGQAEMKSLPAWQTIQNARDQFKSFSANKMINLGDLESLKQYDALKNEYRQKGADYETQLKQLDVQNKLNTAQPAFTDLQSLKINNVQDAVVAKDKLARAQQQLQILQGTFNDVKTLKAKVEADFGSSQTLLQRVNALKDQDLQALSSKLQLPSLSYENLARSLVGPLWLSRLDGAIGLIEKGRQYMPARKPKDKKIVRTRLKGTDVSFPLASVPPDFLIKTVFVSGSTGGEGKANTPFDFSGKITDITSDPQLLGRPTRVKLAGSQGKQTFTLTADLDHTREIPEDRFELALQGISAASLKLPASDYLPRFDQGSLAVTTQVALIGDRLEATLTAVLSGLGAPQPSEGGNADTKDLVKTLWTGIGAVDVKARAAGTGDNLDLSVSSNLDHLLGDRLKGMVGGKLAELQQRLRAEIDRATAAKQKELMAQLDDQKKGLLGKLGVDEKLVQDKLNAGQGVVNNQQNAAGQAADQQKKQAEEQLKNKAQDQLQNLFKR